MGRASELGRPKTGVFRRLGRRALGASRVGKSRGIADLGPAARNPGRNQRPATRDPERPGPPSPARIFVKMPGPAGTLVRIGILIIFFCNIGEHIHQYIYTCLKIDLRPMFSVKR